MNGILCMNKPEGFTSFDVIGKLRGILKIKRLGHAGTLDPMATGVLPIFVGNATKACDILPNNEKSYRASFRLGLVTDTQDITGRIISKETDIPDEPEVRIAIERFRGELEQIPPMYSAVKIGGKKLYELARKGESIERKPRHITIFGLEITGRSDNDYILDVVCSKGTYIRTLCHDIGAALGCGGCMSSLRRTKSGVFSVDNAYTIAEIQEAADRGEEEKLLLPIDTLFAGYTKLSVDADSEKKLKNGCIINTSSPDGRFRVYSEDGEFLLLGDVKDGVMKTVKNFFEV